jgi:septal ring factor EnvC (AmiA/AmiB activator)
MESSYKMWLYPSWTAPAPTPLEHLKTQDGAVVLNKDDVKELEDLIDDCEKRAKILSTTSEALDAAEDLIKQQETEAALMHQEIRLLERENVKLQEALTERKLAAEKDEKRIESLEASLADAYKVITEQAKRLGGSSKFGAITKVLIFAAGIAAGAYADR